MEIKIGDKFNDWVVIGSKFIKKKLPYIKCQCKCGKVSNINCYNLINSKSKSCLQCARNKLINDLSNKKFGKLLVIKRMRKNNKKGGSRWLCQCDCGGKAFTYEAYELENNIKTECRTCAITKLPMHQYFIKIKNAAKQRKIIFNITEQDLENQWTKQNGKCIFTGKQLLKIFTYSYFKSNDVNASLDRIDSSKGYEVDNIQWVCKDINFAKLSLSNQDFIQMCKNIMDYQNEKTTI